MFKEAKKKYGSERAAKIAWATVKKKYKKEGNEWMLIGRSEDFTITSDNLLVRSEGGEFSRDYFVEGYLATTNVAKDPKHGWSMLANSALLDIEEQVKELGADIFKSDLEHVKTKMDRGIKMSGLYAYDEIMTLEDAKVDEKGLWTKWKLDKYMSEFPKVWNQIKEKHFNAFSIEARYQSKDIDFDYIDGDRVAIIKHAKLEKGTLSKTPRDKSAKVTSVYEK